MKALKIIDNVMFQYLLPMLLGVLFLGVLYFYSDVTYSNLQLPVGIYKHNIWHESDYLTYYRPAVNFLEYGVFGEEYMPDPLRTVGYPAFLSALIFLFRENWIYWAYFIQCLFIPLIYPSIYFIIKRVVNLKAARMVLMWSLLSGLYFGRLISIGTDLVFLTLFLIALVSLIKYFETKGKAIFILLYILFLFLASEVRPTLIWFFAIHIPVVIYLDNRYRVFATVRRRRFFLLYSSIIIFLVTNIPSWRNYVHYGFFKPTTVLNANYVNHLSRYILDKEGQSGRFDSIYKMQYEEKNYIKRMHLQNKIAVSIIQELPVGFIKVIIMNIKNVMLDNGITNQIGQYFNYNWREYPGLAQSDCLFYSYFVFAGIYVIIYCFTFYGLYILIRRKKWNILIIVCMLLATMLFPTFIFGSGGARLRMPVEWVLVTIASYGYLSLRSKNLKEDPLGRA